MQTINKIDYSELEITLEEEEAWTLFIKRFEQLKEENIRLEKESVSGVLSTSNRPL